MRIQRILHWIMTQNLMDFLGANLSVVVLSPLQENLNTSHIWCPLWGFSVSGDHHNFLIFIALAIDNSGT